MNLFEFIIWLQEHNALEAYINNVKRVGAVGMVSTLSRFLPAETLFNAFIWSETPEGDEYWRDLEREIVEEVE